MDLIKTAFWNTREKRLRMVWRLALQNLLLLILLIISEVLISLISDIFTKETGLTNPPEVLFGGSPLFLLVSFLVRGGFLTLCVWAAGRYLDKRPFIDFGFRFNSCWWKDFWFGLGLGAILISVIFLVELAAGWIRPVGYLVTSNPDIPFLVEILVPLLIFTAIGFYEELLSRGYLLTNLAEGFSGRYLKPRSAILLGCLLSSMAFGLSHAANPNSSLLTTLNISLAGIFLATGFILTGELAIPIGLHISWNFFQGAVFGFPVSGTVFGSASVIQIQQSGPDWLTGGSFGPEGGVLGIISYLLGILLIILWIKLSKGDVSVQTAISSPPQAQMQSNSSGSPPISPAAIFHGIQHIIWDWNGTLLDDLDLCLTTINEMLAARGYERISKSTYLDIFGFPVINYYKKIGFDFIDESFEDISTEFISSYEAGRPDCSLMNGTSSLLRLIHASGTSQSILSASKKAYLDQAVIDYSIQDYFTIVDGLDNHHAASKLALAQKHISRIDLPPDSILMIGDTLHDADIASELGLRCCLIPNGHNSIQRLGKSTATIIRSLTELRSLYQTSLE